MRAAWAITMDRNLKQSTHDRVIGQLSEILGKPMEQLQRSYDSPRQSPLLPAIVKALPEGVAKAMFKCVTTFQGMPPLAHVVNDPRYVGR